MIYATASGMSITAGKTITYDGWVALMISQVTIDYGHIEPILRIQLCSLLWQYSAPVPDKDLLELGVVTTERITVMSTQMVTPIP
jgi:hypothetical protein